MSIYVILNLAVFAGLILALATLRAKSLSRRILAGLAAGVVYGLALQFLYADGGVIAGTLEWTNVVGGAYVSLLRMIIIPLVLVMMIAAVVRMEEVSALGRIGGMVIGILVGTTMVAALVGIFISNAFGLSAEGLTQGARELERSQVLS